jgi:hypothetical protein
MGADGFCSLFSTPEKLSPISVASAANLSPKSLMLLAGAPGRIRTSDPQIRSFGQVPKPG